LEALYRAAGFQPPALNEALAAIGLSAPVGRTQLEALVKAKKLVKVSGDLIFHHDVLEHVKRSLAPHKGRRFSVPEFKEWTNISRKFAIPLLEFLDRERVTRREGDGRIVL
jgi:selenocysteine-specific elongation factor